MLVKIGTVNIDTVAGYQVAYKAVVDSKNSFMTADGVQHNCILKQKVTLNVPLAHLNSTKITSLMTALSGDTVSVAYRTPLGTSGTATCQCLNKAYIMTACYNNSTQLWSLSLVLEEV